MTESNTALATFLLRKHACSFAFSYFSDIHRWLWPCISFPSFVLEIHLWTEDQKPLSSGFILTEFFGAIFYANPLDLHRFCLSNTNQPAFKQMLGQRLVTSVYIFNDSVLILRWCLLNETEECLRTLQGSLTGGAEGRGGVKWYRFLPGSTGEIDGL